MTLDQITRLLGDKATDLLDHQCKTVDKSHLHLPGPDFVDRIFIQSDRVPAVLRNLQTMFDHGRLGGTGYLPSFLSIRVSNILPEPLLRQTRNILIPKISSSWRLKVAVTLSHQHLASSALWHGSMRTASRLSSRSITMNCCHIRISTTRFCLQALIRHLTWAQ